MAKHENRSTEVGRHIRKTVIPPRMSVTEAARMLGVGRPALSNLLNGKAALSQDMALRLERTFGADRMTLLELQATSDQERRRVQDRTVAVGTYVPSFLTITARQIEEWAARNVRARDHLPVLLRRLIHSTGRELRHVDFPGYDNAQRRGWDGQIEADAATPWVPEGRSGWEFGADQRPDRKAELDYQARLRMFSPAERASCTFVFVTPRNWTGKGEWVRRKEVTGDWKAVKALDASDLEQWVETTIAPRIWLARELDIPTEGFEALDHFWSRWAEASDPPMTGAIFEPSVAAHVDTFKKWLEKEAGARAGDVAPDSAGGPVRATDVPTGSERPFTVAADSKEEAIAFLACLLRHDDVPDGLHDRTVVFASSGSLRTLAASTAPFIPIVYSEEAERELATVYRRRHCIVVRPRNAVDREADVSVELLGHEAFVKALADMGVERERSDRPAGESGRSPTVLRRRLSKIDAIRTPPWAGDKAVARRLIPMTLVGAWHRESMADCEVLAALADRDYNAVEESVADLLQHDDCPVWCVGQYRGVVSKIDALFAIRPWMTAKDVTDFVDFAEYVLSESDPALELPEDQRWAAGIYGKLREHSSALRSGVCETLVMLSVHGDALFRRRFGIDVPARVAGLVGRLLTPFTSDKLRSHDHDLPAYAEAAPDEFLALLEEDLTQPQPALKALLRPAGAGWFDGPARTGVLWALERLGWNPQTLMRVVLILARLSQTTIDDNWLNKPINSLAGIFLSWLPQTAAPLDDRIKALETLCRRFPDVGWQICIQQVEGPYQIGRHSARPRWRNDAAGAGQGVPPDERFGFERKARRLAIAWSTHDEATLGELVERLANMTEEEQISVWDRVDAWSRTTTDDKARAELRERIRRSVFIQRGPARGPEAAQPDRAREIFDELAPDDPVVRHGWLFAGSWVEYSADELDERELDFDERARRIHQLRTEAMAEIWSARGRDAVPALLAECDAWTVGRYAASCAVDQREAADVLGTGLSIATMSGADLDNFMRGFLAALDEDARSAIVASLAQAGAVDETARLIACAPFRDQTWRLLDGQDPRVRERYWRTVLPTMEQFTESETTEMLDRLLAVGRPREAFCAVRLAWNKVETSRLRRLLKALVEDDTGLANHFRIESWHLSAALDALDGRPGVTVDEMAQLEFACIDALVSLRYTRHRGHGIPNLERKIAESPVLFVQAVALAFKRDDGGEDPPERNVDDPGRSASVANAAHRLLEQVARIPGTDLEGKVDAQALSRWVIEARRLGSEHGRAATGDRKIGQLMSRAPSEEDGSWPCRPVCEVLESIASADIATGFEVGVYNSRGVHSRSLDEGGKQERELSARYRAWAQRLAFDCPYVASILERIAKGYDRDAEREDSEVRVMKRLEH